MASSFPKMECTATSASRTAVWASKENPVWSPQTYTPGTEVCKVLLDEQQRVIGSHVLGNPASEIITLAGTAIELGLTAAQWKKIVFPHPTVGEIFREVL